MIIDVIVFLFKFISDFIMSLDRIKIYNNLSVLHLLVVVLIFEIVMSFLVKSDK